MAPYNHLAVLVTDAERDRAEALLKDAYIDGRIEVGELEHRVGLVLASRTRGELNDCLAGLPTPARPVVPFAARMPDTTSRGTGAAAAAHFLPFVAWIFGPLAVWALSAPRSYARREAAKAFNWQFTASVLIAVMGVVAGILDLVVVNQLLGLAWVGWLVLTIVGGAKAAQGLSWENPVNRVLRWNVLDPSGR